MDLKLESHPQPATINKTHTQKSYIALIENIFHHVKENGKIPTLQLSSLSYLTALELLDSKSLFGGETMTTSTSLINHSLRVASLLVEFGHYLNLDADTLRKLAIGGVIHDIGKVKLDPKILNKKETLTELEFKHVKSHQKHAGNIIKKTNGLSSISKEICLMHHEKLDGSGYPKALSSGNITKYARMAAIVDVYDALTSKRSYKESMNQEQAFRIMRGMRNNHLDGDLLADFFDLLKNKP